MLVYEKDFDGERMNVCVYEIERERERDREGEEMLSLLTIVRCG